LNKPNSIFIAHVDIVHGCQLQCRGCPNSTIMDKVKRMPVSDFSTILGNVDVEHIHTLRLYNFGAPPEDAYEQLRFHTRVMVAAQV